MQAVAEGGLLLVTATDMAGAPLQAVDCRLPLIPRSHGDTDHFLGAW